MVIKYGTEQCTNENPRACYYQTNGIGFFVIELVKIDFKIPINSRLFTKFMKKDLQKINVIVINETVPGKDL